MKFDPVDAMGDGCWHVLSRFLAFCACLWLGSFMGIVAVENTELLGDLFDTFHLFLIAPTALINILFPLTLGLFIAAIFWFRSENSLAIAGPVFCSALSLIIVLRGKPNTWEDFTTQWLIWLVLQCMLGTFSWYHTRLRRNRWLQEMELLRIENDQRRVELKRDFGTDSIDREIEN